MSKKPSFAISLAIPKNFQKLDSDELTELLTSNDTSSSLAIIDVRDVDRIGGHIPGSINVPYGEFEGKCEELTKLYGNKTRVIIYCMYGTLRSPSAALTFIKNLPKDHEGKNVYVLSGGFHDYLKKYHKDTKLVENYDKSYFDEEFLHVNDTNLSSVRLRPDIQQNKK